jgi:spore coat polysaccharide biosynthesis predicted glycosyltransferase SpsG
MTAQEKQIVKEVLEWLTNEKSEFSIMYGNQDKRFSSNDKDYTIDEIIEIYKQTL